MKYARIIVLDYTIRRLSHIRVPNPFTMAYCRTEKFGNVLVTGNNPDVKEYIKKNLGRCLVVYTLWCRHKTRAFVRIENDPAYAIYEIRQGKRKKYALLEKYYDMNLEPRYTSISVWRRIPSTFPRILRDKHDYSKRIAEQKSA